MEAFAAQYSIYYPDRAAPPRLLTDSRLHSPENLPNELKDACPLSVNWLKLKVERGTIRRLQHNGSEHVKPLPRRLFCQHHLPRLHRKPLAGLLVSNIASPHLLPRAAKCSGPLCQGRFSFRKPDRKPANEVEYLWLFHHLEVAGVIAFRGESEETERVAGTASANIPVVYVSYYRQTRSDNRQWIRDENDGGIPGRHHTGASGMQGEQPLAEDPAPRISAGCA